MPRTVVVYDNAPKTFARLESLRAVAVEVGVHSDVDAGGRVRDTSGRFMSKGTTSIALIAGVHEFGAPSVRVPERSYIRTTFDDRRGAYEESLEVIARAWMDGAIPTLKEALNVFGLLVETDIKDTIRNVIPPPLADATIEARQRGRGDLPDNDRFAPGSATPLWDTGRLISSIRSVLTVS